MFRALGQNLRGDHLDLSFRDTERWPRVKAVVRSARGMAVTDYQRH